MRRQPQRLTGDGSAQVSLRPVRRGALAKISTFTRNSGGVRTQYARRKVWEQQLRFFVVASIIASLTVSGLPSSVRAGGPSRNGGRWVVQHSPVTTNLANISCASASECVAVGASATMIRTVNAGTTWKSLSSPYGRTHPSASFTSVRCPVPGVCSVLAVPNVILHTTDGGRTWNKHTITLPSTLSQLGHLACPTRDVCFVTASPSGNTFSWFTHSSAIFKTADGNKTWQRLTTHAFVPCPGDCNNLPVGFDLQWISCQNGQSCRAGGDSFIGSHEGYASGVLRTDNGGATWKLVNQNIFGPNYGTCPTVSVCTGVYYEPQTPTYGPDLDRSTDGGRKWTVKPIKPVLTSIACTGSSFCELAGPHGKLAMAIGLILTQQASPTTRDLNAVACPTVHACYAVGAAGTTLSLKG